MKRRLSSQQQRIWRAYSSPVRESAQCILSIDSAITGKEIERIVNQLFLEQDIFRTSYGIEDGIPFQAAEPTCRLIWKEEELSGFEKETADSLLTEEGRSFKNGEEQARVLLLKGGREQLLLLTVSVLSADKPAFEWLAKEMADRLASAGSPPSNEMPIAYGEYADWQREALAQSDYSGPDYWREERPNTEKRFRLPTGRVRGNAAYENQSLEYPSIGELSSKLRQFAAEYNVTVSDVLLTAWGNVISAILGEEELLFGYRVDGKTSDDLASSFGPYSTLIPVKCAANDSWPLARLAGENGKLIRHAVEWQDYYEPQGAEQALKPFPLSFSYEVKSDNSAAAATPVRVVEAYSYEEPCELSVQFTESGSSISVKLTYDSAHYEKQEVDEIYGTFLLYVEESMSNPGKGMKDLNLVSSDKREQITSLWNDSFQERAGQKRIHDLFEECAQQYPESAAITEEARSITYRELNEQSSELAALLRKNDFRPGMFAGIYMHRGIDSILSILAVMKAGGVFIPLDPDEAAERLAVIVEDASPAVVLSSPRALDRGMTLLGDGVRRIDEIGEIVLLGRDAEAPETNEDLAYIMYTSGSTGKPKGVAIEHDGLTNHILWACKAIFTDGIEHLPQVTRMGFDICLNQIFCPLLVGKEVWIIPEDTIRDTEKLVAELCSRPNVGVNCVPSLWKVVLEELGKTRVSIGDDELGSSLKAYFNAGDKMDDDLTVHTWSVLPDCKVYNFYGPTEASIYATFDRVEPGYQVTLGRPLDNMQVYVLNENLGVLPVGFPGEICIGGIGVSPGYYKRPEVNRERFVKDPFQDEPNAKLYRTGDLGRWLADGRLQFLGRFDDQVKIRGFRIELGEIQIQLNRLPYMYESYVSTRVDHNGDKNLVAYVVFREGEQRDFRQIQKDLRSMLPQYMIPSLYIRLDKLPYTSSGKVDRKKLPQDPLPTLQLETGDVPSTATEIRLADIWSEILGRDGIGVNHNFFDLGGHSLLATRLTSRIRHTFAINISVRLIFEFPTISEMAKELDKQSGFGHELDPGIPRADRSSVMPATFTQERLWSVSQALTDIPLLHQLIPLQLEGEVDVPRLQETLNWLAAKHEALRTSFAVHGDSLVQTINPPQPVPMSVSDLGSHPDRKGELESLALALVEQNFNLEQDQLFLRAHLARTGEREAVLLLVTHQINSDGYSIKILLQDFAAFYLNGEGEAESAIQFADYAKWQRETLDRAVLHKQLAYWESKLGHNSAYSLRIPGEREAEAGALFRKSISFSLEQSLKRDLLQLCNQHGITLFMGLASAFVIQLFLRTGQDDIRLGTMFSKRKRMELERVFGPLTDLIVLNFDVVKDFTVAGVLSHVRDTVLEADANQDISFEEIADHLEQSKSLDRENLVQALIGLEDELEEQEPQSGFSVKKLQVEDVLNWFIPMGYDFELNFVNKKDSIQGHFVYNPTRFDENEVAALAAEFAVLLAKLLKEPHAAIGSFKVKEEANT
ncbi:amino acid adenylation domain-containing protein [Paenibacillus sp. GCM10027627]|uniref:amino acid adenylation domain-containing protein n=1 Tax=unclassified Paenibacillus TaxID=185978 RepID=UPI00363C2330